MECVESNAGRRWKVKGGGWERQRKKKRKTGSVCRRERKKEI